MKCDTNKFTRFQQEHVWKHFLKYDKLDSWLYVGSEFFFAVIPAIAYFIYQVHIDKQKVDKASGRAWSFWLLFLPLLFAVVDMLWYKRLMTIRMTRTMMFGQLVSALLMLLCLDDRVMEYFKRFTETELYATGTALSTVVFVLYIVMGTSEMDQFVDPTYTRTCKIGCRT